MNSFTTNFTFSEEAFLLSSLHEVVKVWRRGFGKASLDFKVNNGKADLQLNFQLGHPYEGHVQDVHGEAVPPHHPPPNQDQDYNQQRKFKKSARRRKRDRERAAQHQAGLRQLGSPAADKSETAGIVQDVILPLSIREENLVPVKPSANGPVRDTASAPGAKPSPSLPPPPLLTPRKLSSPPQNFLSRSYLDVSSTKKQLFAIIDPAACPLAPQASAACKSTPPPRHNPAPQMRYQMREDQLWTSLFEK